MITTLLAINSIAFLVILAVLSIIFIALSAVDEPSPQGSSIVLLIVLILAVLFTEIGPEAWAHPWVAAAYVGGYFLIGCAYSIFVRWPLYLYGLRMRVNATKAEVLKRHSVSYEDLSNNAVALTDWSSKIYEIGRYNGMRIDSTGKLIPPQYSENKARLLTWAILWTWNILWVCIRKPIIFIFEELLNLQILKRISQAMSNWMFKDFNK